MKNSPLLSASCTVLLAGIHFLCLPQETPSHIVPPTLIAELLALNNDLEIPALPVYRSPADLKASPGGSSIYIAEQTAKQVAVCDVAAGTVTKTIQLPNEPTGLALSPDGSKLFASCSSGRWPAGMVCVVNLQSGKVEKRIPAGHSARSPVMHPDGSKLYVCNLFENSVSVINLDAAAETARIKVTREPYAAAITPDGATLVVSNSLPDQRATDTSNAACKISLIATQTNTVVASIPLPLGSHSVFGVCVSPDGKYAFATHLIGRTTLPANILTGGWVHSNNLAIIDIAAKKLANDVELDDNTRGASNPWGLACTDDGKFLCVLHAGSNEMTIIDLPQLLTKAIGAKDLSHDFTTIQSIKKRLAIATKGPRALAVIGQKAYVAGYFSHSLDVVQVSMTTAAPSGSVSLGAEKPMTAQRTGEILFNDASLCFQTWQSCNSCHPFTRPDALNWILAQTENNAPKNVKSMLHTFQTPPTNWSGRRPNAFESVRMGIRIELQLEALPEWTEPLDTFFMRLKPVPSPHLIKGRLNESAQRGKNLFESEKVDCNGCHPAPLFTDMKFHNAGVPDPFDPATSWDTPPLVEAWRTGPYDHIGSSLTIEEVTKIPGHSVNVYKLTPQEFNDLMEYVKSL